LRHAGRFPAKAPLNSAVSPDGAIPGAQKPGRPRHAELDIKMMKQKKARPDRVMTLIKTDEPCPRCRTPRNKHSLSLRHYWELTPDFTKAEFIELRYSKHYCPRCERHYTADMAEYVAPQCLFGIRFKAKALEFLNEESIEKTHLRLRKRYGVMVGLTTLHEWRIKGLAENASTPRTAAAPPALSRQCRRGRPPEARAGVLSPVSGKR
jgi:hypothetical protein